MIVGNKKDLYQDGDEELLQDYIRERGFSASRVLITEQGVLAPSWLEGPALATLDPKPDLSIVRKKGSGFSLSDIPIPQSGMIRATNMGEGFRSIGWRFAAHRIFKRKLLVEFFQGLDVERLKGVFITDEGTFGYNLTGDTRTEMELDDSSESRVELISRHIEKDWEEKLLHCLVEEEK